MNYANSDYNNTANESSSLSDDTIKPTEPNPQQNDTARPFPVARLLLFIFGPGVLLIIVLILQMFAKFLGLEGGGVHVVRAIINIISMLIGLIAVVGILSMPITIILTIVNYNKHKKV